MSEGMCEREERKVEDVNGEHLGVMEEDPFYDDPVLDNNQSPYVDFEYSELR